MNDHRGVDAEKQAGTNQASNGLSTHMELFREFPSVSKDKWKEVAIKELKDGDYDRRLVWKQDDGISIEPIYMFEDLSGLPHLESLPAEAPFVRGGQRPVAEGGWLIAQETSKASPAEANANMKEALERGQNAIAFVIENDSHSGVHIKDVNDLSTLLDGIDIVDRPVVMRAGMRGMEMFSTLLKVCEQRGADTKALKGCVDIDPINDNLDFDSVRKFVTEAAAKTPTFRVVGISSEPYAYAGATTVQELALTLAAGTDALRNIIADGISVDTVAQRMWFSFSVDVNFFQEIAKLRAARMLWSGIVKSFGAVSDGSLVMKQHVRTSRWSQTIYDPYVNILRSTVQTMAAAIGGGGAMTVNPFDELQPVNPELSNRLARNTQIVLQEESHLAQVMDPVAGSYYVEQLTDMLARKSWELFQEIERQGGLMAAMKAGTVQEMLSASLKKKLDAVANRKSVLVGTNQYADSTSLKTKPGDDIVSECGPLVQHRAAEQIEALRYAVDKNSVKPQAFLATFGSVFWRRARATFANGFLGTAGIAVQDNNGFADMNEAADAAVSAGAHIVVACGEDEQYATAVPELINALRARGSKAQVIVAGYPKDAVDGLKTAGVADFIHVKANLITTLSSILKRMDIAIEGEVA
jgi:methylmalonyl-CoA mutase